MISCLHIPNNPAKYVGEAFTFLRRNGSVLQVGWSSGDAAKESGHYIWRALAEIESCQECGEAVNML